jgi:hypothetical protein
MLRTSRRLEFEAFPKTNIPNLIVIKIREDLDLAYIPTPRRVTYPGSFRAETPYRAASLPGVQ